MLSLLTYFCCITTFSVERLLFSLDLFSFDATTIPGLLDLNLNVEPCLYMLDHAIFIQHTL